MKIIRFSCLLLVFLGISCSKEPKTWIYQHTITLDGVNPIGITETAEGIWLSDGDHNRLVLIDGQGETIKTIDSLHRPMHIDQKNNTIYIPEYIGDQVVIIDGVSKEFLEIKDSLDAPAAISLYKEEMAIVDFYNHRVLYDNGDNWISFGWKGNSKGAFYFPTDVQITADKIFVADAYNNRIQIFDKKGKFLKVVGADQKMNAATGMFVSEDELFVTDFENNRLLIFDLEGNLKQQLNNVEKPIDAFISGDYLYVNNFRKGTLSVFKKG